MGDSLGWGVVTQTLGSISRLPIKSFLFFKVVKSAFECFQSSGPSAHEL